MSTTRIRPTLLLAIIGGLTASPAKANDSEALKNPALTGFYAELKALFNKHYPKSTSHLLNNTIHFEHDTRLFLIHGANMDGEWQEASEERGPNRGGILCDIGIGKGEWRQQAALPWTYDSHYFQTFAAAPYSKAHDKHLFARLSYPSDVNEAFLKEFTKLVNEFGKYLNDGIAK